MYGFAGTGPPPSLSQPRRPLELSLLKNRLVEFSSLLGRRILSEGLAKRDLVTRPEKLIQTYEAYCFVSPRISKSRESYELRTSYRSTQQSHEQSYCRPYCFSRVERLERYRTLKTGMLMLYFVATAYVNGCTKSALLLLLCPCIFFNIYCKYDNRLDDPWHENVSNLCFHFLRAEYAMEPPPVT